MRLDPIVIQPYDPSWATAFEQVRRTISPVLAPWLTREIEHIGSTAVPGLAAKAIVDMLAIVSDTDEAAAAVTPMQSVGWVHAPEPGDRDDRRLSFCSPSVERRTHHLHVVEERSDAWRGWLAFRDHLRAHADVASEYGDLKIALAAALGDDPDDRAPYRQGKADFVQRVTALARAGRPS